MLVKHLIDKLLLYPPDMEVFMGGEDGPVDPDITMETIWMNEEDEFRQEEDKDSFKVEVIFIN